MTHTLVLGEALVDAVTGPEGTTVEHIGGSPANVAFGLAALEHQVDLATWIGADPRGERIAALCRTRQVTLTRGSQAAAATSVAHALIRADGSADYTFELEWQLPEVPSPAAYSHLHAGSIGAVLEPGASAVRRTLADAHDHATISYDPNVRPSLMGAPDEARSAIEGVIRLADVVKLSDEDLAWLYPGRSVPDVLRRLGNAGPALVVVTQGSRGVHGLLARSGEELILPAAPVLVVDTVGAGDSFMAGLLSGLLDAGLLGGSSGRARLARAGADDISPALERALSTAARTVSRPGAHAPSRAELV